MKRLSTRMTVAIATALLSKVLSPVRAQLFPLDYSDPYFHRDCAGGKESEKLFVLSFDDGPWMNFTAGILDVLKEKEAPGTFFIIGSQYERFPGLKVEYEQVTRRILREGHIVANHGMDNDEFTVQDVVDCDTVIRRVANDYEAKYFRPAQGAYTRAKYDELLLKTNYRFSMWNLDISDWRFDRNPNDVLALVSAAVASPTTPVPISDAANSGFPRRGSFIMLAHDNHDVLLQPVSGGKVLLAAIIDQVRSEGYKIVSMDECIGLEPSEYDPGSNFCGKDWPEAQQCTTEACPSGMDIECSDGRKCFGSVTCEPNEPDTSGSWRVRTAWFHGLLLAACVMLSCIG